MSGAERPLVVVTGAGRGIGRAIVELALARAWRVVGAEVDPALVDSTATELDDDGLVMSRLDVGDHDAVVRWVEEIVAPLGVPDALVNNAGITRRAMLADVEFADWQKLLDVNLSGAFSTTQAVGRLMIAAGRGSIVSIASTTSLAWSVGASAYPATKAALVMLMQGVALEWGPLGIRANCVSPGYTRTPLSSAEQNPGLLAPRLARVPLGRVAEPAEIAETVMFLCSPAAAYISGQNIAVDGGSTISTLLAPAAVSS